ncbi:tRNA lysidine(34) synthetase TilS [Brooklawnia cerclae]|uniref:tRNA(Ile)-lysidine synthase n=1 Tax=Brooklawnia cerclae TaxID=349934 RepID=A0ABX0SC47_9ACTN|nr:tRNA lysidine(34) synthetase TilS [Brooklawnia cerclae]NIH55561.1 tRNA(Ile)-lysidine synthase [Brooklawnia cerclae]
MARRELGPAGLAVVQAVEPWTRSGRVRVACSGGPDSLALAAAVAHLAGRDASLALRAEALTVDHGLQAGSARVADDVARRLDDLGLPTRVAAVTVDRADPAGLEAAARTARYAALSTGLVDGDVVLLGHTLDDQAETVLLGLARGSGTRSLAGMAPGVALASGALLVRPLLGLRRATTADACAEWGLPAWHDPQNLECRFARVRVRERVMPVLEAELGPGVAEALARTAELARADADELDAVAARVVGSRDGTPQELPVPSLSGLPEAIGGRVLRRWLIGLGVPEPSFGHVRAVRALVTDWHGQAGVDLPGGIRIVRERGVLRQGPRDDG